MKSPRIEVSPTYVLDKLALRVHEELVIKHERFEKGTLRPEDRAVEYGELINLHKLGVWYNTLMKGMNNTVARGYHLYILWHIREFARNPNWESARRRGIHEIGRKFSEKCVKVHLADMEKLKEQPKEQPKEKEHETVHEVPVGRFPRLVRLLHR